MKRAAFFGVLVASSSALAACSALATFDDRPSHDGGGAASNDGAAATGDGTGTDQGIDPGVYANGCQGHAGPEPVKASGFCIDSTEVTNAQYAQFLDGTMGGKPDAQVSSVCASNATYVPANDWPADASRASFPVANVDWCDAAAFCKWAGKRLCGKVGGGSSAPEEAAGATSEWFVACSFGATREFPYTGSYDDKACNGNDRDIGRAVAVGSMAKCEGGYAGVFDLSGNVAEWEDACDGAGGAADRCLVRGGSFDASDSKLTCASVALETRSSTHSDVGFRCCSP